MLVSFLVNVEKIELELIESLKSIILTSSGDIEWEVIIGIDIEQKDFTDKKHFLLERIFRLCEDFCRYKIVICHNQDIPAEDLYQELANSAKGDFMFLWQNDLRLITSDWDRLLKNDFLKKPNTNHLYAGFVKNNLISVHKLPIIKRQSMEEVGKYITDDSDVLKRSRVVLSPLLLPHMEKLDIIR